MPISTRVDSTSGLNSVNNATGLSVERNASNRGVSPFPVDSVVTASVTATVLDASHAGLTLITGSAGAINLVMPLASAVPGARFIFRTLSADAHSLSGSLETAGTKVFVDGQGTSATATGSKLTFPAVVGSVVMLTSDGQKYLMTARSGTMIINGT